MNQRIVVKSEFKASFASAIIVIGIALAGIGFVSYDFSQNLQKIPPPIDKFIPNNDVYYEEIDPHTTWMDGFEVVKTDDDPLEIDQSIGFRAHIVTKELPEEIVMHIFPQNMNDYFTGTGDFDYRDLSTELNRIPSLRYGDIFNIKFDLKNIAENDHYDLNGNASMTFKTDGDYFAQVSIKTKSGQIEHFRSKSIIFTIRDPHEVWVDKSLERLEDSAWKQQVANVRSFGISFIAIGIGMSISGLNLYFANVDAKKREDNDKKTITIKSESEIENNLTDPTSNSPLIKIENGISYYANGWKKDSRGTYWKE